MRIRFLAAAAGTAVALAGAGGAQAAARGPVASWSFDERSGPVAHDGTGHGHDAALRAGAAWTPNGRFGGAIALNGQGAYLEVAAARELDLSRRFTIEAWVRARRLSGTQTVLAKTRPWGGFPYGLELASGRAHAYAATAHGDVDARAARAVKAWAWTFVAATYDGSRVRVYVDGRRVASTRASGDLRSSDGALQIGADTVWGEYLTGRLDNVRLYDRALSPQELAADRTHAVEDTSRRRRGGKASSGGAGAGSGPASGSESGSAGGTTTSGGTTTGGGTAAPPQPPPAAGTANLWIDPDGGSCTRHAAVAAYADGEACGRFQSALDAAQPGDTVLVRCGTGATCSFGAEELSSSKGSESSRITIAAAPGYTVGFDPADGDPVWLHELHNVDLTNIGFGTRNVGARGGFDGNLRIDCSSNVTLTNATGRRFHMFEGNTNVLFEGGSWGGYASPGEEDSSIGTTEWDGPGETCRGDSAPKPSSYITFDHVTFHDVFPNSSASSWGGSHPDCFEINGYTTHVTISNSEFRDCGNTFFSLYGNQGYDYDLTFRDNWLHDLNDRPDSDEWYGIQIHSNPNSSRTPGAGRLGNVLLTGNRIEPANPHAPGPYSGLYVTAANAPGMSPVTITRNTLAILQPPSVCEQSRSAPTLAAWSANTWTAGGPPCGG